MAEMAPLGGARLMILLASIAVGTMGCHVGAGEPPAPLAVDAGSATEGYPVGPYGIGRGSVISNFEFTGYVDPSAGLGEAARSTITLADFHNPTGEGTAPAGSPLGEGQPLPRALLINVSAVWCVACQREASQVLPGEYARFQPQGGELLLDLAESSALGQVADFGDLDNWVTAYDVTYPAVVDPTYQLGALFDSSAFPANILVDPRDMTIVELVSGVPQDGFWLALDELCAAP